jgi:hypothetical protein
VEFREGDLYSPVRDSRFDLIVANPPYVISPESRYLFRDSGMAGDEVSQRVVREGAALLNEGGYLQVICEWAHLAGQDWRNRLAGWFEGSGCDAWVLDFTTVDPLTHAGVWLRADTAEATQTLGQRLEEWLTYHRRAGIEAISDGVISLRKRSGGRNWLRFEHTPGRIGACGTAVERGFAAADFLTESSDEALLDSRLRLAPEVCWEQRAAPTADGWQVRVNQFYLASGLAYRGDVDRQGMMLLDRCRGERTVREVLASLVEPGGAPLNTAGVLEVVRRLVEQGLLLPVDQGHHRPTSRSA